MVVHIGAASSVDDPSPGEPVAVLKVGLVTAAIAAAVVVAPIASPAAQAPADPAAASVATADNAPRWGPPVPGRLLSRFNPPPHPWLAGHRGIDLAAGPGEPVGAVADGVVAFAGMVAGRGVVSVQHNWLRSTYEPVSPSVVAGETVRSGQQIGLVSGSAHEGCGCLHLGARRGSEYLDPWKLLRSPSRLLSVTQAG